MRRRSIEYRYKCAEGCGTIGPEFKSLKKARAYLERVRAGEVTGRPEPGMTIMRIRRYPDGGFQSEMLVNDKWVPWHDYFLDYVERAQKS